MRIAPVSGCAGGATRDTPASGTKTSRWSRPSVHRERLEVDVAGLVVSGPEGASVDREQRHRHPVPEQAGLDAPVVADLIGRDDRTVAEAHQGPVPIRAVVDGGL